MFNCFFYKRLISSPLLLTQTQPRSVTRTHPDLRFPIAFLLPQTFYVAVAAPLPLTPACFAPSSLHAPPRPAVFTCDLLCPPLTPASPSLRPQLSLRVKALKRQVDESEGEVERLEGVRRKVLRDLEEQQELQEALQAKVTALETELK